MANCILYGNKNDDYFVDTVDESYIETAIKKYHSQGYLLKLLATDYIGIGKQLEIDMMIINGNRKITLDI